MDQLQWQSLIIEQRVAPPRLEDHQFRTWMTDRPIFVSSVMDEEMNPARAAVRAWIRKWGGEPVMWEELAPRDQHSERAYLEGVERSRVFALLLGTAYGVSDQTGFPPTHKEANRAEQLHITRLLFQPIGVQSAERDGRLNAWVGSLYHQVSGGKYSDPDELVAQLEKRLREIASAQESPWVKLGPIVFPGRVHRHSTGGTTEFIVTAMVREVAVRRALAELTGMRRHTRVDRLTSGINSWPIDVVNTSIDSGTVSEEEVTITCRLASNRGSMANPLGGVTYVEHGRRIGPSEQAELWAAYAVFGQEPTAGRDNLVSRSRIAPDGPTLPEVLAERQAQGWLAEGLVRLYLLEWLSWKFGGHFDHIEVGPATASGVRVNAGYRPEGFDQPVVGIVGVVPLSS